MASKRTLPVVHYCDSTAVLLRYATMPRFCEAVVIGERSAKVAQAEANMLGICILSFIHVSDWREMDEVLVGYGASPVDMYIPF